MLIRESFPVGPLGCNCTLIACDESQEGVVVDPGGDVRKILERAKAWGVQIVKILHTHAHFDHLGATKALHDATSALRFLHESDLFLYENVPMQSSFFGITTEPPGGLEGKLHDNMILSFGKESCQILHTPGHTPGSCCFHFNSISLLTSGDTLFYEGVGRTDLWQGDFGELQKSIKEKLFKLPFETIVVPGHGPETTIGHEIKMNPFLRG